MAILWGGTGADTLTGGAEDNTIGGGGGHDRLTGNSARDQIFGGDGDDTITGGAGDDYLEGGAGRDTFVLRPDDGWDYIGDFQAGAGGDVLDLTAWTGITDVNALLASATSDGNDTILTFGPTASVRLAGVARSALTADNVRLAASGIPGGAPAGGTLSLGPATVGVAEGSGGGTTSFLFTVTRSGDLSAAASVNWSVTGSGTAAVAAADFVGDALPSGIASFAAGQSTATISVPVRADTAVETDEGFTVTLSAPSAGWTIAAGSATGLIVNDDAAAGGGTPGQILTGTAARDELYGTAGNDTITGGAGNDYMEGGAGSDRFVINAGDGWDAIGDFQAGAGGDVLDLRSWGLSSADALLASATEDSGGTVLNLDSTTGVRLMGITKASLTAANLQLGDAPQPPAGPSITGVDWGPAAFDTTAVTRIGAAADGVQGDYDLSNGLISPDGRYLAFNSSVPLASGVTADLFLKDLQTGVIMPIHLPATAQTPRTNVTAFNFSADGTKLLYTGSYSSGPYAPYVRSDINIYDIASGALTTIDNGGNFAKNLQLSADGGALLYTSQQSATQYPSPPVTIHRNMATGSETAIRSPSGALAGNGVRLSHDGTLVAYTSAEGMYLRNMVTGQQTRLDLLADGSVPATPVTVSLKAISRDGRYVLFDSTDARLAAGDTNGVRDVFVRDVQTGTTSRVSTAADGAQGNDYSEGYGFTADGRSVLFTSAASNFVAGDSNDRIDAFVKDLDSGAVRRVSTAADGSQSNADVAPPSISADGSRVLFGSLASSLSSGDSNGRYDAFAVDLDKLDDAGQAGIPGMVNLSVGFAAGGAAVTQATIAWGDGQSTSQSLVAGASALTATHHYTGTGSFNGTITLTDANGAIVSDGFRAQLAAPANALRLESLTADGSQFQGHADDPALSADGRFLAFGSSLLVKDLQTGAMASAHTRADGTAANGLARERSLSADGRYIAFASTSTNLVAGDINNRVDIFVKDRQSGAVTLASSATDGTQANLDSSTPMLSADGRYVVFTSNASNLVAGDPNADARDVFVKDLQTGTLVRASARADGGGGATSGSGTPPASIGGRISADGRYVLFTSYASDLVEGDTAASLDVFLKDLQTGALRRVNTNDTEVLELDFSSDIALSANGRYAAFAGRTSDPVPAGTDPHWDVFVKDLQTGTLSKASAAADGTASNGGSTDVRISDDGRYVAFISDATNLVANDANGASDAFIKDMATGEVTLVGSSVSQKTRSGGLTGLSMSGDGRYVAGEAMSDRLLPSDTNGYYDTMLFDRLAPGVTLTGDDGRDVLVGNALGDTLTGGGGEDFLSGGLGDDMLLGGDGNDVLVGGAGADTLTGGAGADVFAFGIAGGMDLVIDFDAAGGDRLQIGIGQSWTVETSGNDALVRFSTTDGALLSGTRPDQVSAGWFITG